ncbi:gonadotropin-releasing hormone II receptor-like [Amphibalanus amphitrite]|uniref:gonadotropin-releasing hormone II receptor-like n=1 Tax=Amphibalanus amphitrite TaxID=1232801 RepID=UPI001C9182FD|nr:gonadotropin-releasing hormone II receptor-like [Amphibalanus amphitrite]
MRDASTLIFRVQVHPEYRHLNFVQCIDKGSYANDTTRLLYLFFTLFFMYLLPLLVITFCYTGIVVSLTRRSAPPDSDTLFRANDSGFFVRARQRTLQMTFVIVLTFVICWTPYNVISVWHWVHQESFKLVHPLLRKSLFIFAVANSVANPMVYGFYHSQLCQRIEAPPSSRGKSQSVELAILETAPTCDTLLRHPSSSTLRSATGRRIPGRDGITRAAALQQEHPPRITGSPVSGRHQL